MKREAIIGFALVVLFLFSVFPTRMCAGQGASITLNPTQGYAFSTVQFTLSGFHPQGGFEIWPDVTHENATALSTYPPEFLDASGGAVGTFTELTPAHGTPNTVTFMAQAYGAGVDYYVYAYASFTVLPPTITLYPTSGPVGTTVSVTGHGFLSGGASIEGNPVYRYVDLTADSNGDISGSFNVSSYPDPWGPPTLGVCTVYAVDGSGSYGTAPFTVTASPSPSPTPSPSPSPSPSPTPTPTPTPTPPTTNPTITLSPTSGPVGSTISFSLNGFLPNDKVTVKFGTLTSGVGFDVVTNSNGFYLGQLTVPSVAWGTYQVSATDSNLPAVYASFKVTLPIAPVIYPDPIRGPVGSSVALTLSGFLPDASVGIVFGAEVHPDTMHMDVKTDEKGGAHTAFTVPPVGAGTYYILIAADEQGNSAAASFFVTGVPPTITLSPRQGPVGSTVNFYASNFPPDIYLIVQFDNVGGAPVDVTADGNGYAHGSFPVPSEPPGTYTVKATDTVPDAVSTQFNVIVSAASTATVSANSVAVAQSATTGVSVKVSGASLLNGAQITVNSIDYGDSQPSGTGNVSLAQAVFYDVSVASSSGALGSDVNANVSISNPSFNSSSVIEYYHGNAWVSVATVFTAPETLSATIPALALIGTPIVVGIPSHSGSVNPFVIDFGSTAFVLMLVAVVVVTISAVVLVARKLTRTRSVSKSTNQVEK